VILVAGISLSLVFLIHWASQPQPLPVDPAWAVEGDSIVPEGALTVRFTGTSTLLFSDGETSWMIDGWFSRFGPLALLAGSIEPDMVAIERGLAQNDVKQLQFVIPIHSHFDHAMDAPEVARRTGAVLLGSESTAWIGRGWGLDEKQIEIAESGKTYAIGDFSVTLIETDHFAFPDPEVRERALGDPRITAPLVPPVDAFEYRVGRAYAIHVEHPRGRFLVQGSAGYREGGLAGYPSDTVFLGIGGLGTQTADYRERYWQETVVLPGAERVIPIHYDSLTAPIEGPFVGEIRAASLLAEGAEETRRFLQEKTGVAGPSGKRIEILTLPRYDEVVLYR
jgi:L-ascorbate metabolism protein UlaG (beta-lactamase superfamily)